MADEWADFRQNPADPWADFRGKPSGAADIAEDVAKSGGIGLVKGAIGVAAAPGDMRSLLSAGVDYAADKIGLDPAQVQTFKDYAYEGLRRVPGPVGQAVSTPTSGQVQKAIEGYTGDFYKPKTVAGEYAQTIGEFAPAAVGGPAGLVRKTAGVVIPAVVSESAGQLTKGTQAEPWARFAGALVGGAGTALASRPGTASAAIRQQLPEGVTPQMVDQADALIQHAAGQGVQLAWPEALSQVAGRPVLTNVMRHLEASPQTEGRMAEFFGQRPQQVEQAARQQFDQLAPVNPNPSTIGRAAGAAAEGEVTMTRQAINQAAEPYYRAAENTLLTPQEMDLIRRRVPGFEEARQAVRGDPQLNRYVEHLPDESVGFLNEVKKYLDTAAENAAGPFNQQRNQQRAAGYGRDAENVRGAARFVDDTYAGGNYRQALDIQTRGREQILQPLLDGYVGKLAQSDQTTQQAIKTLFPKNPLPNSAQEVAGAVAALNRQNPRVASDLVRAHAESTFNEAVRDLQTGPAAAGGAKFRTAIVGNPQQAANLEAAITALPNGAQRWEGFNRFLDVLEATGTRQGIGSRTAYNAEINKAYSAGGVARDAAKIGANPARILQPLADRYDQYKLGRNLDQLARILTDPGAANQLRAIARMPDRSAAATSMALKLVTYGESAAR